MLRSHKSVRPCYLIKSVFVQPSVKFFISSQTVILIAGYVYTESIYCLFSDR